MGKKVKPYGVKKSLITITRLETAFYPLAEAQARLFPFFELEKATDRNEIACTAKSCVERAVWDLWEMDQNLSQEEIYQSLERFMKGYLYNLRWIVNRKYHGEGKHTVIGFEDLKNERHVDQDIDWEDIFAIPEQVGQNMSELEAAESVWYSIANRLKLPQAFYLIEQLSPRLQIAVLDRFGYINNGLPVKEKLEKYGMGYHEGLSNNFSDAIKQIYKSLPREFTGNEKPSKSIAEIIGNNELSQVYRLNNRVLHHDSPRLVLRRLRDNPQFVAKLSPKERQVFFLATEVDDDNKFRYSNNEISRDLGQAEGTVEGYLTECLKIANLDKPRFPSRVSKGGAIILEGSAQYDLILKRSSLSPEQLSSLSVIQRRLLDFLTTPDAEGIYPREADAAREIGIKGNGLAKVILNLVEHPDYILDLKQKIEISLATNKEQFSDEQLKIMGYLLEQINTGRPLKPPTTGSLAWKTITKELNLPPQRGYAIEKKLNSMFPNEPQ